MHKIWDRRTYDHKIACELTSEIIIYHDLPFWYVEYEKIRMKDKNPSICSMCREREWGSRVELVYYLGFLTRWNSTYEMLVRALKIWKAFTIVSLLTLIIDHYLKKSGTVEKRYVSCWILSSHYYSFIGFQVSHI